MTAEVLCITETWLNDTISNGMIADNIFNIYRKDRGVLTSDKNRGGGVLIATRNNLIADHIPTLHEDLEQIFVKIKCCDSLLVIGCIYIPPNANREIYEKHLDDIKNINIRYNNKGNNKVLILGDYNLPDFVEDINSNLAKDGVSPRLDTILLEEFASQGLVQCNGILNSKGRLLDLCWANFGVIVKEDKPLIQEDSYHPALSISTDLDTIEDQIETYYCFKKGNYGGFNNYLLNINWIPLYSLTDINDMVQLLYDVIKEGMDNYVPVVTKYPSRFPVWFSPELKKYIKKKKIAHSRYKDTGNQRLYDKFSDLRSKCKNLSKICYESYVNKIENDIKNNPIKFWDFVRTKRNDAKNIPSEMSWGSIKANGEEDIANLLAKYFASVYDTSNDSGEDDNDDWEIPRWKGPTTDIKNFEINYDDTLKGLLGLNVRKGAGPDGIPNILLRECAVGLCEPINFIFNRTFKLGIFPESWKTSFITPIYKTGDRSKVENYRPVCIQSAMPKLLEKLILPGIAFGTKSIINARQHGFVEGRSTITNLYIYINTIIDALSNGYEVHAINTDFSKAFDIMDPTELITTMEDVGFQDKALDWSRSFVEGRSMKVKIKQAVSSAFSAKSGVPQGSHLGPKFFIIDTNDMGEVIESEYDCFADDTKIYRVIKSREDTRVLQNDLDNLVKWCKRKKLVLNIKKCSVMVFHRSNNAKFEASYHIRNQQLEKVSEIKDLGIIIDDKLKFTKHIDMVIRKAKKVLGCITRIGQDFVKLETLMQLYTSLVRPSLEYGSIIWSPQYQVHIQRLEAVQLGFVRHIKYLWKQRGVKLTTEETRRRMKLMSLEQRRKLLDLCFFHKIINYKIESPEILKDIKFCVPTKLLRENRLLEEHRDRRNFIASGPRNRIITIVNQYASDVDFFNGNYNKVKKDIIKLLKDF